MADPETLFGLLRQRHEALLLARRAHEGLWLDLATFMVPRRLPALRAGATLPSLAPIVVPTVYDSTAMHAVDLLAATMHASLTSGAIRWFRLRMRDPRLDQDHLVRQWLDECADRLYAAFAQSAFGAEIVELYTDLVVFGTGALAILEASPAGGLDFKHLPIGTYAFAEDEGGPPLVIRSAALSREFVRARWPEAGLTGPPDDLVVVHQAILPAPQPLPTGHRVLSVVWTDAAPQRPLSVGRFYEHPIVIARWARLWGSPWGWGPGAHALPDVRTANKAVELALKAWAKAIDPPLVLRSDGVLGPTRLYPGGITYAMDPARDIVPLRLEARHDVTQLNLQELRAAIRQAFFVDQLQLPGPQPTYMTATEVDLRYQLMQRVLGPTLGRLESELLGPLVRRSFLLMLRAGAFPPVPPLLALAARAGLAEVDIEWEGLLPRARRHQDLDAIHRTLALIGPLVQLNPAVLDNYDLDAAARSIGRLAGLPEAYFRAPEAVQRMREARATLQAQQVQAAQGLQQAELAEKATGMIRALTA